LLSPHATTHALAPIKSRITRSSGTDSLSLSLEGPSWLNYSIQTSNDLISWRDVPNITSAQFNKVILDGLPATSDRIFYRAYSQ
jgi:hypothetical protein